MSLCAPRETYRSAFTERASVCPSATSVAARVMGRPSRNTCPAEINAWAWVRERAKPRPARTLSARIGRLGIVVKALGEGFLNLVEKLGLLLWIFG